MNSDLFIYDDIIEKYLRSKDNDYCLCGSGKLFSQCHKINSKKPEKNPFEIYKRINSIKNKKVKQCYFENNECSSIYSFSHSIPKQSLENIQDNRHVLHFVLPGAKIDADILENYSVEPEEIGINEIGCYNGFCNFHDTKLFAPIEINKIIPSKEQALLTRLRALTKEYYTKINTTNFIPIINDIAASKTTRFDQQKLGAYSSQFFTGTFKALKEFQQEILLLKTYILKRNYSNYHSKIYIFDNLFPIHCCAYINPIFSISGNFLQDLDDLETDCFSFSMNCFNKDEKTYLFFNWQKDTLLDLFFNEFKSISNENIPSFMIQFILAYCENNAIKKTWWNSLSIIKKKRLIRLSFIDLLEAPEIHNPIEDFRSICFTSSQLLEIIDL